jgi:hypothetical protein
MGYRLKAGESVAKGVQRIVDTELSLAMLELRDSGAPRPDEAIHEARRHIEKIRGALRLVRPALAGGYKASNRRLRAANRLLAPIDDGRAVVETLARLRRKHGLRPDGRALAAIRAALVERAARIDRRTEGDRVLPRVAALLRAELEHVSTWSLSESGCNAVAPGLERSVRRTRVAMRRAIEQPTTANYHIWRHRVKDLWWHVRLIESRVGGKLLRIERGLEALDGCLGEYHNVIVLEDALTIGTPVTPAQAAAGIRLLRLYQRELRLRAARLGGRVLNEKPRQFVRRVKRLWHAQRIHGRAAARERSWPRAA